MTRGTTIAVAALLAALLAGCQEGETITAPALVAACEARPSSGQAPLPVSFVLAVSGAEGPFTVSVSYGDGATGTNPDVPHTYSAAGVFTASFVVSTATQSARCAATVSVTPGTAATPPPSSNQPPVAVFKTIPDPVGRTIGGPAPLSVRYNMCATADPEKDRLFFWIDVEGDGKWDARGTTGASCRRDAVYAAGTYEPLLCVTDVGPADQPLHPEQCRSFTVVATP